MDLSTVMRYLQNQIQHKNCDRIVKTENRFSVQGLNLSHFIQSCELRPCPEVRFSLSYPGFYAGSDTVNKSYQWKSQLK